MDPVASTPFRPNAGTEMKRRTMTLYAGFLATIPVFSPLDDDDLYRISDVCREISFDAGETIFSEGGEGDHLYIVMTGCVDVWKESGSERAERVTVLGPGQMFGELALIDQFARSATVTAREPCRVLGIRRDDFERIARPSPILRAVMQVLSSLIRERTEVFVRGLRRRNRELETANQALRASEARLEAALAEKNQLLREIHHHVARNLETVHRLLQLQAESEVSLDVRDHFAEAESRVRALALVHETLARNPDLPCVDAQDYLERLVGERISAGNAGERIQATVSATDVCLSLETAVPVGLIVDELVTRSLRSAFPEDQPGAIAVKLTMGAETVLSVADNGAPIPPSPLAADALSLRIARGLAEDQLDGRLDVAVDAGTRVVVRFAADSA